MLLTLKRRQFYTICNKFFRKPNLFKQSIVILKKYTRHFSVEKMLKIRQITGNDMIFLR